MPDDELVDLGDAAAAEARRRRAAVLAAERVLGPGPVYQGVGKTIRYLTATGKYADQPQRVDPLEHAGTIAALRKVAGTLDRMMGHNLTGWVANGRDLAPVLEQYRQLLEHMVGKEQSDALLDWLADDTAPQELPGVGRT